MLTERAYADDRHIRPRTQIVADVGCGNGFDLRQIVPQGPVAPEFDDAEGVSHDNNPYFGAPFHNGPRARAAAVDVTFTGTRDCVGDAGQFRAIAS
jgi:hypothetical protein